MKTFSEHLIALQTAIQAHFSTFSVLYWEYACNFWRGVVLGEYLCGIRTKQKGRGVVGYPPTRDSYLRITIRLTS